MKRIIINAQGSAEVLQLVDTPLPEPSPNKVRIRVESSGVNFFDIYKRTGMYDVQFPYQMGEEASGTVDSVGSSVQEFQPGDRVAYCYCSGSYAEYNVVPVEKVIRIPEDLDMRRAAAVLLQGMTAHYLTHDTFPLAAGHIALIHAAAGGTGQLLVQFAKMRGATVIATVSTEQKAQLVANLGADEVIIYTESDFELEAKRITKGKGVDVVYDSVGKSTFHKGINILRPRGHMILFGQSSGKIDTFDPQILNVRGSLYLTRPSLSHYILGREELVKRANDVFRFVNEGKLSVNIAQTYPLAEALLAHRQLESRATNGKILLIP